MWVGVQLAKPAGDRLDGRWFALWPFGAVPEGSVDHVGNRRLDLPSRKSGQILFSYSNRLADSYLGAGLEKADQNSCSKAATHNLWLDKAWV